MRTFDKICMAFLTALVCCYAFLPHLEAQQLQPKNAMNGYQGNFIVSSAAIASGQTASAVVQLKGYSLVGVQLPAAFTGTTLTFQVSSDGVTFVALKSTTSGTALSYTVAQGTYAAIDPVAFYGVNYLKIVSGSSEGANRVLAISLKGI